MKNNRIVRAYDSINPSLTDKQRMLDQILQEANLEEKREKTLRKPVPRVHTARAKPYKKSNPLGLIAASLAVFLLAGILLTRMIRQPSDISATRPVTEATENMVQDHYAPIVAKYNQAIADGWSREQCEIEGISPRMQAGSDVTKAGYVFTDLDGDGREELIIAEESTDRTDNIWDLYTTLEDGTPIQLWVDELDGGQCRLYVDNVISIAFSMKHELEQTFYKLEEGKLAALESLQWEDEDTVFHTDSEGNTRQITSQEGQAIGYSYEHQKLTLTWFTGTPDYLRDTDALERYLPTIEMYWTAIEEGWPRGLCVENGINMLTPIESEYESLYYAIHDLNNDGTPELIISEYPYRENTDTNFLDIYTILDGHVIQLMSLGDLDMRFLCEGGVVKDLTPPERGDFNAYISFWEIREDQFVQTGAVYEIDGQWHHGFRASEKITAAEAEAEVKSYKPLKLEFTEIKSAGETVYQSGYEAFDHIINKYVTALTDNWSEQQCEENDISSEILDDTTIRHNLGWCLLDIDGNGVEELVVSDGVTLFDLYVMQPHNGGPGHLICANGGESWQLCENNVIENQGRYSGTAAWRHYTLKETDIIQQDIVFYDGELNQYYYGDNGEKLNPITKDKAGEFICRERTAELSLTLFVEPEPFNPDSQEYYEPLLNIYRQAIREDLGPGDCVQQGISLMVGYYGDFVEALGYTTMDLDNNGIEELIITDGTNIYDLYTIVQDEETGPLRLVDAMERIEYFLTEDHMIYHSGSGGAGMHVYSLSALEGHDLRMMTGFMYAPDTDPDNPWFWYDGIDQGEPCGYDAQPIIDNWKIVNIPFTSFE